MMLEKVEEGKLPMEFEYTLLFVGSFFVVHIINAYLLAISFPSNGTYPNWWLKDGFTLKMWVSFALALENMGIV